MKPKILLLAFSATLSIILFTSCTTSYKTGQTPDDVYYSPARPADEYVRTEKKDERKYRNNDDQYYEDQYLRMKVRNRYRWSEIDDPYYYSSRSNYSYYNCFCFGNPWTPTSYWNNHYNPYYQSTVILNPKSATTYSAPRRFNLNAYNNNALTNSNYSNPKIKSEPRINTYNTPRYIEPRRNENSGNILRDIFNGNSSSGSSGNSSSSSPKTSSSSSSSSSSSGSSTPSNAPVRKF